MSHSDGSLVGSLQCNAINLCLRTIHTTPPAFMKREDPDVVPRIPLELGLQHR